LLGRDGPAAKGGDEFLYIAHSVGTDGKAASAPPRKLRCPACWQLMRPSGRGADPSRRCPPAGSPCLLKLHQGGNQFLRLPRPPSRRATGPKMPHRFAFLRNGYAGEREKGDRSAMKDRLRIALLVMTASGLAGCATAPQPQSVNARAVCEQMTRDSASSPELVSPDFFKQCMIARGANPTKD
jgi:hypothetical protein